MYYRSSCKQCEVKKQKAYESLPAIRDRNKFYEAKRSYGIAPDEYVFLTERADGVCEVCGGSYKLSIDHCHSTGDIRGLLCHYCNMGLGAFKDNESLLHKAVAYLQREPVFKARKGRRING